MKVNVKANGILSLFVAIAILTVLTMYTTSLGAREANLPELPPPAVPSTGEDGALVDALGNDRTRGSALKIFQGAFANRWERQPANHSKKAAAPGRQEENASAMVVPTDGSGLKLHHDPFDSAPFDRLTFRLHGGETGNQRVRITGLLRNKDQRPTTLPPLPVGQWVTVVIPLRQLQVNARFTVDGFRFCTDKTGVRVDGIGLLTANDPAPETRAAPLFPDKAQ